MRYFQKQSPDVFCEKGVFKKIEKFTEKHLCQSLFLTLFKRDSNTGVFLKFLRTAFLKNICEQLLLYSFSVLGFTKYFLTSSGFKTLVPPNLCLLLRLFCLLNIHNASFSGSLNRLSALSSYQKFVPIDNVFNLSSAFI